VDLFLGIVVTIATVVGVIATIIQQRQSNRHFAEQNRIMIAQGGGKVSETPVYKPPAWPLVAMIVMVLLCWGAALYGHYQNRPAQDFQKLGEEWDKYDLKKIANLSYSHETVHLDGYEYINTNFDNVTFWYDGKAPTRFTDVHFVNLKKGEMNLRVGSSNPVVKQSLLVARELQGIAGCPPLTMQRPPSP